MKVARSLAQGVTPLILLAAIVAVGAWAGRASVLRKARAEREMEHRSIATTTVQKGDFQVTVGGVGALEAVLSKPAVAEVTGQIISVVPNGVRVREGDVIAVLDAPRMERQLRDQQVQYENAVADLEAKQRELAARVRQSEIALEQAREELSRFRREKAAELKDKESQHAHDSQNFALNRERTERKERLAQEGLVPQREVELGATALERDRYSVERQTKDLETTRYRTEAEDLDRQAAVTRAESELAQAKAAQEDELQNAAITVQIQKRQLERLGEQLSKAAITAPAAGIVVLVEQREGMSLRTLQPGDQIWEGRTVATIPDLSQMRAVLEVPQEQARAIKRKQRAVVRVEALPGLELEGEVTEIAQTASETTYRGTGMPTAERTFRTYVEVKDIKDAALRPGMTANVEIIVNHLPDAVSVPLEAVFDRDDRKVVFVRRGDRFDTVEVRLGDENPHTVVILEGLTGGEEVALRDVAARGVRSNEGGDESLSGPQF